MYQSYDDTDMDMSGSFILETSLYHAPVPKSQAIIVRKSFPESWIWDLFYGGFVSMNFCECFLHDYLVRCVVSSMNDSFNIILPMYAV